MIFQGLIVNMGGLVEAPQLKMHVLKTDRPESESQFCHSLVL